MTKEPQTPESLAWGELQRRGSIPPRYLRNLEREVARELARCLAHRAPNRIAALLDHHREANSDAGN